MPNETEDYNNAVRAALPSGMTFSGDRYRYNNHSFSPYKLAAWYYYYILRTGGGVPTFSPASLFAASEQGVWYDPSDLTTLFQDSAGTTPVTATGQTVGLMLDKSGRGNHATQATTASRPTYGVVPLGGRRNLLLATDTMATQSSTVTAAAHTLSFTGTGTVTLTGASVAGPLVGTGAGNRVSLTFTPTAGSLTLTVVGSVTFAQLELGSTATDYQKVTTAFNVTQAGVASLSYLSFDGVDDSMVTNTITPAIDKAQVFAGVRKVSTVIGVIAEHSAITDNNNGTMMLLGNWGGRGGFRSKGTVPADANVPFSGAIETLVMTGVGDIAGDVAAIRFNGSERPWATTDQGTGNYLAYPLYIGRRGGTTLPFNGQLYSLIVRFGANLTTGTITSTETYVAGKTGVTL